MQRFTLSSIRFFIAHVQAFCYDRVMKMYITLALCFAPLIVEIVFSLIKISSFRLSQAGWAVAAGFAAIVPIIIVQYILQQTDWFSVSSMPSLLAEALIFNGLIEEAVKMLLPKKKSTQSNKINP